MLLSQDVEDDLIEKYPNLYWREGDLLFYRNGKDESTFIVQVSVYRSVI
jgi:hypothetical protein